MLLLNSSLSNIDKRLKLNNTVQKLNYEGQVQISLVKPVTASPSLGYKEFVPPFFQKKKITSLRPV